MALAKTYKKSSQSIDRLTPIQFEVTQRNGTEPRFRNEFWDHHAFGLYVDVVSGEPLFLRLISSIRRVAGLASLSPFPPARSSRLTISAMVCGALRSARPTQTATWGTSFRTDHGTREAFAIASIPLHCGLFQPIGLLTRAMENS